jgi:nitrite reductase/ring-hydroxylating ferredoxin subunit
MMEVDLGRVEDLPDDRCVSVADGRAVAVRVDGGVRVFQSRCLHKEASLAEGRIVDGKLQCPLHFWRYRLADGVHVGGLGALATYPVRVHEGRAVASVPDPEPEMSLRERLLAHAHEWDRGDR